MPLSFQNKTWEEIQAILNGEAVDDTATDIETPKEDFESMSWEEIQAALAERDADVPPELQTPEVAEPEPQRAPIADRSDFGTDQFNDSGADLTAAAESEVTRTADLGNRFYRGVADIAASVPESLAISSQAGIRRGGETGNVEAALGMGGSMSDGLGHDLVVSRLAEEAGGREAVLEAAKGRDLTDLADDPLFQYAQKVKENAQKNHPTNPEWDEEFTSKLASGAGSLVAFGVTSIVSPIAPVLLGASANSVAQFEDAVRNGSDIDDALTAFYVGGAVGTSEALPITFMFNRFNKATGNRFSKLVSDKFVSILDKQKAGVQAGARIGAEGVVGAFEEATQEVLQDFANNVVAKDIVGYDKEREYLSSLEDTAGVGGGLGFVMSTLMTSAGMSKRAIRQSNLESSLLKDIIPGTAERQAVDALNPNRAQIQQTPIEAADTRAVPDVKSLPKAATTTVTLGEHTQLPDAANSAAFFDSEEQELGDLARLIIRGQVNGPDLEAAQARINEYVERTVAETQSRVVDFPAEQEVANEPVVPAIEPAVEEPTPVVPREIVADYENGYHTLSTDGGTLSAVESEDGKTVAIDTINVNEDAQGKGRGSALYRKLFEIADRKGQTVESASSITEAAYRTWKSLERAGVPVTFNPNVSTIADAQGNTQYESRDDAPVATYGAQQEREATSTVKKGDDFSSTGEWIVTLPSGATEIMFFDRSDRSWYSKSEFDAARSRSRPAFTIGYNKAEALAELERRDAEKAAPKREATTEETVPGDGPKLTTDMAPSELPQVINQAGMGGFRSLVEFFANRIYGGNVEGMKFEVDPDGTKRIYIKADGEKYAQVWTMKKGQASINFGEDSKNIDLADFDSATGIDIRLSRKDGKTDKVVALPQKEATFTSPEQRQAEFDKDSISGMSFEELVAKYPDKKAELTKGPLAPLKEAALPTAVANELTLDMQAIDKPGRTIERTIQGQQIVARRTAGGFTWAVKGAVSSDKNSGRVDFEEQAAAPAKPKAPERLQEQVLPPPAPPAPPTGPASLDGTGGLTPGDTRSQATGVIASIAAIGGKENVNLETEGIDVKTTVVTGTDGTQRTVHRVTTRDGNSHTLSNEDVGQMLLTTEFNLRKPKESIKAWLDRKFNSSLSTSKKITNAILRAPIMQMHGAQRTLKTQYDAIQESWRAKYGRDISEATPEALKAMNGYIAGNVDLDTVQGATGMDAAFFKHLDKIRLNIDLLSNAMLEGNMVENDLQFVIEKGLGEYFRVQYTLKDFDAKTSDPTALYRLIPERIRNDVSRALKKAYLTPIQEGQRLSRGAITRMATHYGLTESKLVGSKTIVDEETGKERGREEVAVLKGTDLPLGTAKVQDLQLALTAMITEEMVMPEKVILGFLQGSGTGQAASQHGREKGIERAKKLSRSEEALKDAGFSEDEIALQGTLRAMLAEYLDPISVAQQTTNAMLNHVSSHTMVNAIAQLDKIGLASRTGANIKSGATVALVPKGDKWADVRVVDPTNGSTIPASQLFVRPEVKDAFERLVKPNFQTGPFINGIRYVQGATKMSLTALNLASHPRNMRSAVEIVAWRGYLLNPNLAQVSRALAATSKLVARDSAFGFRGKVKDDQDAASAYLVSLGLFHDGIRTGPIKDMLVRTMGSKDAITAFGHDTYLSTTGQSVEDTLNSATSPLAHKLRSQINKMPPHLREGARKALLDGPLSAYRLEDEGFKIFAWLQEREFVAEAMGRKDLLEVITGKRNPTEQERPALLEIDKKAAAKVRNQIPTYSLVPEVIKDASANLLAVPFPSFNAEMIRNTIHDVGDMAAMAGYLLKGDNSRANYYHGMDKTIVARRFLERSMSWVAMGTYTAGQVATIGFTYGLYAAGATPDEEDEISLGAVELTKKIREGYKPSRTDYDAYAPFLTALAPQWAREGLHKVVDFTPGKEIVIADMGFTMPYGQLLSLFQNLGGAGQAVWEGDGKEANRALRQSVFQFAGEYATEEPLAKALIEAYNSETTFGQELEGSDRILHVLKVATPYAQVYKTGNRLWTQDPNDPHKQTITDLLKGERPITLTLDKRYESSLWEPQLELMDRLTEAKNLLRKAAKDTMGDEEFKEEYRAIEEDRQAAMAQAAFVNHSADVLGLGSLERRRILSRSSLQGSNRIKRYDFITGTWRPILLRPRDLYGKNKPMDSKLNREYMRYFKLMREVARDMETE